MVLVAVVVVLLVVEHVVRQSGGDYQQRARSHDMATRKLLTFLDRLRATAVKSVRTARVPISGGPEAGQRPEPDRPGVVPEGVGRPDRCLNVCQMAAL